MSAREPNVALLRQTLAHIEAHPEIWYQSEWMAAIEGADDNECGTAYCFGGWAIVLHGGTLTSDADDFEGNVYAESPPGELVNLFEYGPHDAFTCEDGRTVLYVGAYARKVLGLADGPGTRLFDERNDLPTIRRIVGELCGDES